MDAMLKNTGTTARRAALAALMLLGGCVGGSPTAATSDPLWLADAEPLETISEDAWEEAPPDCEGMLTETVSFRVASLDAGLVACVDSAGEVVCVDTVEDISSDLDESGRDAEAEALTAGFVAAVHAEQVSLEMGQGLASDPEPQPNSRPRGIGDPEPQPN